MSEKRLIECLYFNCAWLELWSDGTVTWKASTDANAVADDRIRQFEMQQLWQAKQAAPLPG